MGVVSVNGISIRAYHGCIDQEGDIGGQFTVNVKVHAPFLQAALSDDLQYAIDYVVITDLVKKEMQIRAKLIETVAYRIVKAIENTYNFTSEIEVEIVKHRAPIQSNVKQVSVYLNSKDLS